MIGCTPVDLLADRWRCDQCDAVFDVPRPHRHTSCMVTADSTLGWRFEVHVDGWLVHHCEVGS